MRKHVFRLSDNVRHNPISTVKAELEALTSGFRNKRNCTKVLTSFTVTVQLFGDSVFAYGKNKHVLYDAYEMLFANCKFYYIICLYFMYCSCFLLYVCVYQ